MSSENSRIREQGTGGMSSANRGLRRPHASTQERLLNGSNDTRAQKSHEASSPRKQSSLSADAPEFVPKFATQAPANLSVTAAEFVPRNSYPAYAHTQEADQLYESVQRLVIRPPHANSQASNYTRDQILLEFKNTLSKVTMNPGNLEEMMKPVIDILKATDEVKVNDIIEPLFIQCVTEPNFQYTGARICKLLCRQLKDKKSFSDFQQNLLVRCKEEYLKKDDFVTGMTPDTVSRLCGFTMFIGELFLNLEEDTPNGVRQKIGFLRVPILRDLLLVLLTHPTDFTVKCATQLLKLTGSTLEDTAYLNQPGDGSYDEVFMQIRQLDSNHSLNKTSKCLIKSVLNLKDNNWGRSKSATSTSSEDGLTQDYIQPTFTQNQPVFYNNQGQPITAEEAGYYDPEYDGFSLEEEAEAYAQWEAGNLDEQHWDPNSYVPWSDTSDMGLGYDNGYNQGYVENYMDEEMVAAYEEFLKQQQAQGHH